MFRIKKYQRYLTATILLFLLGATACNKQLDVDSSRQSSEAVHWKSIDDARGGLMSLYGLFRAALADNNAHWLWGELRNGDFTALNRPDLAAVISGNVNASYPVLQEITNWRRFYAAINACNLFIERSGEAMVDMRYSELNNKVDIAQARVVRAFAYFYMVRIWGDVPLITRSHDGQFPEVGRTAKEKVLEYAQKEIEEAAPQLPFVYGGNDPLLPGLYHNANNDHWRNMLFNRVSAYVILSHITAWQGNYFETANYTDYVMRNYQRVNVNYVTTVQLTQRNGLFNARGDGINQYQLVAFPFLGSLGEATVSGHIEQLTLAQPLVSKQLPDIYITNDSLAAMFPSELGQDQRFGRDTSTIYQGTPTLYRDSYITNYGEEIPVFSKIKAINGGSSTASQFNVFTSAIMFSRLEEVALLRAEALTVLGQEADAIDLLNTVKRSRNVNEYATASGEDLLTAIMEERRRELVGEGWRWYDLVRYHRVKRADAAFNQLLDQEGIYWPLATEVLTRNSQLEQNSYWK